VPKIIFIELAVENKLKYVCDITEKLYNSGRQIQIYTERPADAKRIDDFLWTWKQDTFIPHTLYSSPAETKFDPVKITTSEDLPAQADVLIEFDPLKAETFAEYKLIVDFAEIYNPQKLQDSRNRYKTARDSKQFDLEFTRLGTFLGTEIGKN